MTPISTDVASSILTEVTKVGTYVIGSLGNLAGVFLAVAGIGLVLGMLHAAVSFRRG